MSLLNIFPVITPVKAQPESNIRSNPRQVSEANFPVNGSTGEKLQFLLNYAVLAPSGHNTQPWLFKVVDDAIELYADYSRALPTVDPNHRELTISCGAALFHLRLAVRHFGYRDIVEIFPEQLNCNLLARICLGSKRIVKAEENFLFRAIPRRCTNRLTFDNNRLPASLVAELKSAKCLEGDWLQIAIQDIPEAYRQEVVSLIVEGDRQQMANPRFRQELARWILSDRSPKHDSITAAVREMDRRLEAIAPLISFAVRSFNLSKSPADIDRKLAKEAPLLILISSEDDTPQDWIAAGESLAHLLLRARIDDVWASSFNQPIEIPQLRSRLQTLFPENGYPQILLRLGYARETAPTSRRTIDGVVD